jgi:hypothetical protein
MLGLAMDREMSTMTKLSLRELEERRFVEIG